MNKLKRFLPAAFVLLCFVWLLILTLKYQTGFRDGDSLTHYVYSRCALHNPIYFLHLWGKPLFILFSTLFSQAGFMGIKIFNLVCGTLTAWLCYILAKRWHY